MVHDNSDDEDDKACEEEKLQMSLCHKWTRMQVCALGGSEPAPST